MKMFSVFITCFADLISKELLRSKVDDREGSDGENYFQILLDLSGAII